jgi:hypothetical protein
MKQMRKRQETSLSPAFFCRSGYPKYGRLKTELNNAHVAGQNNYPKMAESAMTMLSHYMNDKGVHMTGEDRGQMDQKSFMQKHKQERDVLQVWQEGPLCKQVSQWGQQ